MIRTFPGISRIPLIILRIILALPATICRIDVGIIAMNTSEIVVRLRCNENIDDAVFNIEDAT